MARRLTTVAILVALIGLFVALNGCVQPMEPTATAKENFDTTLPDTPTVTPSSVHQTHTTGGVTLDYYGNGVTQPVLNWSATPGEPVRYRLDGGPWIGPSTTLASPFVPPALGDGLHLFEIQERDASGNWSKERVYRFMVDNTPPAAPLISDRTPGATANLSPRFYWFGDTNGGSRRFEVTLNGPGVNVSPSYDFSGLPPGSEFSASPATFSGSGNVTFSVVELDYALNPSDPATFSMNIDVDGPTYTAQPTSPTNQSTGNSWSWQSSGAVGADDNFEWELRTSPLPGSLLDSGTLTPGPGSYTPGSLTDGSYQLRVRESRNGGSSWSLWAESSVLTVDTTAPGVPTITSPTSGLLTSSSSIGFQWAGETGATFTYELNGPTSIGPANTAGTNYTATGLTDGSYTFDLYQSDAAGNSGAIASRSFSVDATPPAVTLSVPPPSLTNNRTISFSFSSPDPDAEYLVSLSSTPPGSGWSAVAPSSFTLPNGDGAYTLYFFAGDPAGNLSSTSDSVTLDRSVTAVSGLSSGDLIASTPYKSAISYTPTFSWNVGEAGSTYAFSLDGGSTALSNGTGTTATTGNLVPGLYDFTVRQTDPAGNVSSWATPLTFEVPTLDVLAIWFETAALTQDSSTYNNTLSQDTVLGQDAPQIVSSDYVDLRSSIHAGYYVPPPNNLSGGANGQTVSFWIYGNAFGPNNNETGTILSRDRTDGAPSTTVFTINTAPQYDPDLIRLAVNQYAQVGADVSGGDLGTGWNHIVYVFNYAELTIESYVNGASNSNGSITGASQFSEMTDPGPFYIGRSPGGTGSDEAAYVELDSVRLYNYPMSSSQVSDLYAGGR
jgi:hypothetical protein